MLTDLSQQTDGSWGQALDPSLLFLRCFLHQIHNVPDPMCFSTLMGLKRYVYIVKRVITKQIVRKNTKFFNII